MRYGQKTSERADSALCGSKYAKTYQLSRNLSSCSPLVFYSDLFFVFFLSEQQRTDFCLYLFSLLRTSNREILLSPLFSKERILTLYPTLVNSMYFIPFDKPWVHMFQERRIKTAPKYSFTAHLLYFIYF